MQFGICKLLAVDCDCWVNQVDLYLHFSFNPRKFRQILKICICFFFFLILSLQHNLLHRFVCEFAIAACC